MRRAVLLLATLVLALPAAAHAAPDTPPPGANDFTCKPTAAKPRPLVLVHGLGANMDNNWAFMAPRLKAEGWCVFALTYGLDARQASSPYRPGGVMRMQDSARELRSFVARVRRATGAKEVDLVGHSEGTVMPRWYLERLGGAKRVRRFVALTPLWRGTEIAGTPWLRDLGAVFGLDKPIIEAVEQFCASCPQFVRGSEYLNALNADGERIPGVWHTNIVTRYDELVIPFTSGIMRDGGRNIVVQDVCPFNLSEHAFVAYDPVVFQLIRNALDARHAQEVRC
ncbi:MAG TPA: alpha/beta fold hydrolase [Baekduia sp.]|nr:alpha/beta fold hydrolase [Baekduia sp.]